MARSDLLVKLVKAGVHGDQALFERSVEAIVAEERAKNHNVLADRLAEELQSRRSNSKALSPSTAIFNQASGVHNYIAEVVPRRSFGDLVLTEIMRRFIGELVEEHQRKDLLRSYGLEPRHKVLLVGPPGNGKTSLAEAIAEALYLPFFIVKYEGIIGSYLGETAQRIKAVIDYARLRECVLFFDEFETLGKERGDPNETGEIKRVVSSLLLQIDDLPSHVIVVTATNHSELLDKAVWRRFQIRFEMHAPTLNGVTEWLNRFEERLPESLGPSKNMIANRFKGTSFAELEEFGLDLLRRYVLGQPSSNMQDVVQKRLTLWNETVKMTDKI